MQDTSHSLLERLQRTQDEENWFQFSEIYLPLIRRWLHQQNVSQHDADDLSQEVMAVVTTKLKDFDHAGRTGSFRAWVKNIVTNCLRNHWRKHARMDVRGGTVWEEQVRQLNDPQSELSQLWDRQHDQHVLRVVLEMAQPKFEPATWQAFELLTLKNQSVDDAAKTLNMSKNAVCVAKSRVLATVRKLAQGLIDL
jgi:RNA polymerase sigma-70 factor, ECF subfamily